MPLELRVEPNGTLRPFWYGRFGINGRRHCVNLGIKIHGTPPASMSLRDEGDTAFERSRALAQAKYERLVEEARTTRDSARLVERLYEIKTGETIKSVKLEDLPDEWASIPRRRKPNERYAQQCQSLLARFTAFVRQENPKVEQIGQVTRTMARAFMNTETERGITGKTWNDALKLLRTTFKHLLPDGAINPFSDTPTKETEPIFRKPFTPEELGRIIEAARNDDFIRPILVVGMCTAMRRGDCCLLKWSDVDLERRFITVKTAKTGQTVSIPIFPMLFDELAKRSRGRNEFAFPLQAQMYLENPDGITWRVKKVLAVALSKKAEDEEADAALLEVSDKEARLRGLEYIAKLAESDKKRRMKLVFELYMDGKRTCDIVAGAGVSKGSASNYLNEIEKEIGCRIVRGRSNGGSVAALLKTDSGLLRADREHGTRRASLRDFHSFRVTWVTLALTAGVPIELVQKVTGHRTADIVMKHYFQPGREAFRKALHAAMPKLLTNGQKPPREEMLEIVEGMTPKTLKRDKARLLELVAVL